MARYVKTADAQAAVRGREHEILQRTGVDWHAGRKNHCDCPYNGCKGDWRFDAKKERCYCTCLTKPHSIFDHVSMMRGDDPKSREAYEKSKIEAMEILGRDDLIAETRREQSGTASVVRIAQQPWHEAFLYSRLLNPPEELRDDDIVRKYLAARLGIDPAEVIMPTTPYVGLRELEFYDPPDKRNNRLLVGRFPCAVFGMVDTKGEVVGAIRVYLSPDGKTKADLGNDADGNKRKVKPFARGNQSGGEVLFGNPETATVKATCEGVETGASIFHAAMAHHDGRVLVGCGGTATGMAATGRQPNIIKLVAACDRDERQKHPDKPASQAGLRYGRQLASNHYESVAVSIALPGDAGESVDWLDILHRDGVDAVYNGVFRDCKPYEPTDDDATNEEGRQAEESGIENGQADEFQPTRQLNLGSDVELAKAVVEDLTEQYGTVVFCEGAFWRYDETHWKRFSERQIRLRIHAYDGMEYPNDNDGVSRVKLRKSMIDSIINESKAIAMDEDFFSRPAIGINVKNGFILIGEGENAKPVIVPHSPDHRVRHIVNGKWSGNAVEERRIGSMLTKLLSGPFKGDPEAEQKINLIGELIGSAALGAATRIRAPKAVIFVGTMAQNGKSQILELIESVLPEDAVTSISPSNFSKQEYLIKLSGKLLNTVAELAPASVIAGDTFKKIVTGDKVDAKDLYASVVTFKPAAQHIFSTQTLPKFTSGLDRGVQRRVMVLEFNRTIPDREQVANISAIIAETEMDLLIDFAVDGAVRLMSQGGFTEPASSKEAVAKWVLQADPVLSWLQECTVTVQGKAPAKLGVSMAYQAFKQWCIDATYTPVPGLHDFSDRVVASGRGIVKRRSSSGMVLEGLQMTKEEAFKSFGKAY